jgi:hypothetical protein
MGSKFWQGNNRSVPADSIINLLPLHWQISTCTSQGIVEHFEQQALRTAPQVFMARGTSEGSIHISAASIKL